MAKQNMFKFNVKNLKFSVKTANVYAAPEDLAYANSITLEADYNELKLYGDGEILAIIGDDKGKTGTLGVTNLDDAYEVAMKRAMEITEGLADVQQRHSIHHAIYYEVEAIEDGATITIKNWLLNCVTGKASETYNQTTDDPTINAYEYPLTVMGDVLLNNAGTEDYVDANGNTVKVYRVTSYPGDTGYETFGSAVPEPTAAV